MLLKMIKSKDLHMFTTMQFGTVLTTLRTIDSLYEIRKQRNIYIGVRGEII